MFYTDCCTFLEMLLIKDGLFNLTDYGGPQFVNLQAFNKACLLRTAERTIPQWSNSVQMLTEAAENFLPAQLVFQKQFWGNQWDKKAIAMNLAEAVYNFCGGLLGKVSKTTCQGTTGHLQASFQRSSPELFAGTVHP